MQVQLGKCVSLICVGEFGIREKSLSEDGIIYELKRLGIGI